MRGSSQAVDSELGQPFFAWLSARTGADGREIGVAGAMRLASPQTAEDTEVLRAHAAAFIAERFPAPAGVDPAPGPVGLRALKREFAGIRYGGDDGRLGCLVVLGTRARTRRGDTRSGRGREAGCARARRDRDRTGYPGSGTQGQDRE